MGQFDESEIHGSHLRLLIALFGVMLLPTDVGSITWLEPPPVETVRDASSVSTTTKQVIQGSLNEEMSCNFSLPADMTARIVALKVGELTAAIVVSNELRSVEPAFTKRFGVVWVPNKLTLIFFNVTDAQEAEYFCEVTTVGRSARLWSRKIQLLVLDPTQAMAPSITVSHNPIQTTVPADTASEDPSQIMVSSITVLQNPSQAMAPSITVSHIGVLWAVIGSAVAVILVIFIAIVCLCWKWAKCCKREEVRHDNQQGNDSEGIDMQVQGVYAQSGPRAADGLNDNVITQEGQSKRGIQGKNEDHSVSVSLSVA